MITGVSDSERLYGNVYAAYSLICQALSVCWEGGGPLAADWMEEVDDGLLELGVDAVEFTAFQGSTTVALPGGYVIDRGYGEWTHEQCVAAVAQWDATTVDQREELDSDVLDWVEMGMDLAAEAAKKPGHGVAGFFHN